MTDRHTATTTARTLHTILDAVKPFTDTGCPPLGVVRIEADRGTITATATNRYVAAHCRGDATGTLPAAHLELRHVTGIVDALKPIVDRDAALITTAETLIEIATHGGTFEITVGRIRSRVNLADGRNWPNLAAVFAGGPTVDTSQLNGAVGIDLKWLQLLPQMRTNAATRMSFAGPGRPIRVEVGDRFVALVMPMRLDGTETRVPFGLPAVEAVAA